MQDLKNKIEAVLFITARAMTIEEIAQFCSIGSIGTIKEALQALRKDYETRVGSLEIIEEEGRYRLNIKKQYTHLSTKLLSAAELDAPTQATLALIAYKQPVQQADIIKMRGNTAYDHIHALREMEFIASEKSGRTRTLKLAPKFFEYFDVIQENLQKRLDETMEKQEKLAEHAPEEKIVEEILVEEKKEELTPVLKEKKKRKYENKEATIALDVPLELDKTTKEVILSLDADDFGSKC